MRRIVATAVAVAAALLLQLTLINRLHLPGGGTPDLVLLLVAAVGLAGGPVPGMTTGFIAGLSLDLAASASQLIGEYALVFCLIGWACGRLRGTVARSAVLPIVIAAAAAAIGEVLVAVLGIALDPAQVTLAAVRQVLPAAVIYDMALSPFVLYLVLLVSASLSGPLAGVARPAGGGTG
jgi:rod shape-determining protein MreD